MPSVGDLRISNKVLFVAVLIGALFPINNLSADQKKGPEVSRAGLLALAQSVPSLVGTKWSGRDSDGDKLFLHFLDRGVLRYKNPKRWYDNGRWKQSGKKVIFEMNNHYSDYEGRITGRKIAGTARNIKHHRWSWTVTRD